MNYQQLTSLFRVEERSVHVRPRDLSNILITVGAGRLVVGFDRARSGVIVGNFIGTLCGPW